MINILNGIVTDNQEIVFEKNKESALQKLSLYKFSVGEVVVVGYYTERSTPENPTQDVMVAIGLVEGRGPENYRIIADQRVVVVTSVLKSMPDVNVIALNQRYVARDEADGKLYYLSRFRSPETGNVVIEQREIVDKCTIMDASQGEMYVCNPPELVSFYDVIVKPGFSKIENDNGDITVEVSADGEKYGDLHFVTKEEKELLESQLFEKNFTTQITLQKYDKLGNPTSSVDPCEVAKVVFTLTAKYSGNPVVLDSVPAGWEFNEASKTYTKTETGNTTIGSGSPSCVYKEKSKTASGVTSVVNKYFFILYSDATLPTKDEIIRSGQAHLVSSIKGNYTIQPRQNLYTWFIFPQGMEPSSITQLGLNYIAPETNKLNGVTWKQTNLGTYTLYHSLNTGNGLQQNIVIS